MTKQKKSKRIKFTFDERSLSSLENMTDEDKKNYTEIKVINPQTSKLESVFIPKGEK